MSKPDEVRQFMRRQLGEDWVQRLLRSARSWAPTRRTRKPTQRNDAPSTS